MPSDIDENFLIRAGASVSEALQRIDRNHQGMILVTDAEGAVRAMATDGDIRRRLLADPDLTQPIDNCANSEFTWVAQGASREKILKRLDTDRRVLPVLDASLRLVGIVTRESFRLDDEGQVVARARAPVRISFGGGGTDLTRHFVDHGGSVINCTISRYAYATLRKRPDHRIRMRSTALPGELEAESLDDLSVGGAFGLLASVVKVIEPEFGFELEVLSECPPGSGLGGSASVAAAIAGCFNEFRSDKWDEYQLAEIAFQAERLMLGIPGGWQDQYAAVFGGFNFITFASSSNEVVPLRLSSATLRELEASLLLCGLGRSRSKPSESSARNATGKRLKHADRLTELAVEMRRALVRGRLYDFGGLLNEAWLAKKEIDSGASDSFVDGLYDEAIKAGALGGKMLGAAGGGFLLLFAPPMRRERIFRDMTSAGLTCEGVRFEDAGLQSWKVREKSVIIAEGEFNED